MFTPESSRDFLKLKKEFDPLIKTLCSKVSYKKYGMTFEDVEGLFFDKLIHIFFKYYTNKSWEDLKFLTTRSLLNYLTKIYKKQGTTVRLDDGELLNYIIPIENEPSYRDLTMNLFLEFLKAKLPIKDFNLFILLHYPPLYITSRLKNMEKRIPSSLFLEFLGFSPEKTLIKRFNQIRRNLDEQVKILALQFKQIEGVC